MPLLNALVNGEQANVNIEERALHYGDGVFETMLMKQGVIHFWNDHWRRLQRSCQKLSINLVIEDLILSDIERLVSGRKHQEFLLIKLIISRGVGGRGLAVPNNLTATRLALAYDYQLKEKKPMRLKICKTPLYENADLAGIKHTNRLPYILAAQELADNNIDEGILLNAQSQMIECLTHNLFFIKGDQVFTAPINRCGVEGVMRERIILLARQLEINVSETALAVNQLEQVDDCFITNAVIGVQSVAQIGSYTFKPSSIFNRLQEQL